MAFDFEKYSTYIINKSKFFGYYFSIDNLKDVEIILSKIKELHKRATHICYSYKFVDKHGISYVKANDDHEPKGTGGYAILNLIEKRNLNNCFLIVVRYFGKSKLGKGVLLRSYLKAASLIIDEINEKH